MRGVAPSDAKESLPDAEESLPEPVEGSIPSPLPRPVGGHRVAVRAGRGAVPTRVFCYAADAGQDYAVIAEAGGMKNLVVADGDGWALKDNPDHAGYRAAE